LLSQTTIKLVPITNYMESLVYLRTAYNTTADARREWVLTC